MTEYERQQNKLLAWDAVGAYLNGEEREGGIFNDYEVISEILKIGGYTEADINRFLRRL